MSLLYSLYYKGDLIAQFTYASDLDSFLDKHTLNSKLPFFTILVHYPEDKKIPKIIQVKTLKQLVGVVTR